MKPRTPRRPHTKKPDRFTNPDASRAETLAHFALGPFDEACREMDRKWGTDRLPQLVPAPMAHVWGQTMANLNEAIVASYSATDTEQARANIIACVESALRGFAAMDAEAEKNGRDKADAKIWEYDLDGYRFAIIEDDRMWHGIKVERPDLLLFTMREVAVALRLHHSGEAFEAAVKEHFPNARLIETRKTLPKSFFDNGGDSLTEAGL